jgi:hypothetical protein
MSNKTDPAMSSDNGGDNTSPDADVGETLRLNKQTLKDLSPSDDTADKVRGGQPVLCSKLYSGCRS